MKKLAIVGYLYFLLVTGVFLWLNAQEHALMDRYIAEQSKNTFVRNYMHDSHSYTGNIVVTNNVYYSYSFIQPGDVP